MLKSIHHRRGKKNEQSFDSGMTQKILQLSTCFWVDVKVNNLSVVGHIGIDSIQTFLHNKNVNFEILFGLCAQAVPKGHDIVTLRIMKMILKTTVKRPSASYAAKGGHFQSEKLYCTDDDHSIMRESFSLVQNTLFIDYSDVILAL